MDKRDWVKKLWDRKYWAILVCIAVGILLHFAYDFLGQNAFVGIFAATNESVWEHLKIALWPEYIFLLVYLAIKKPPLSQWVVAGGWLLLTTSFILTTFYYTYTGIIGDHFVVIDIAIFILSILFGFYMFFGLMAEEKQHSLILTIFCAMVLAAFLFFLCFFTKFPPSLGMFDPNVIPGQ